MLPPHTRTPAASATDPAPLWNSAHANRDNGDSGNSSWWRLALAAALAVVGIAATASLLA